MTRLALLPLAAITAAGGLLGTRGATGSRATSPDVASSTAFAATPVAADVGTYWRTPDTLAVYDRRPEVGISAPIDKLSYVSQLGMRLARITVYWDPRPQFTDDVLVPALRSARAAGVELVVVVHNQAQCRERHRDAVGDYVAFVADLARRYPAVRFWELFNEQDAPGWTNLFGGRGAAGCAPGRASEHDQGVAYAQMLKRAYPAIKAANPNAWVLVGGLTGTGGWTFIDGIYDGGGRRYYDFMAIHTYGDTPNEPVGGRGATVAARLARLGDAGRPVWNTEFGAGASSFPGGNPGPHPAKPVVPHWSLQGRRDGPAYDSAQVDWWRSALAINASRRLYVKMLGYGLVQGNPSEGAPAGASLPAGMRGADYGTGLLRSDGRTPRPAFRFVQGLGYNAAILRTPDRTVDVEVAAPGKAPSGYRYDTLPNGRIRIHDVRVSSLYPTQIRFVTR